MVTVPGRERISPARLTVMLTGAVAVLSIVTGIANIGAQTVIGPLAGVVPRPIQQAAGFTGTLTGFVLLLSAYGLRRGLKVAWYAAVVLVLVTAVQGLVQSSPLSLPLVVGSLLALPSLLATRGRFERDLTLSTSQLAAGAALLGVQVYGTVGAYALRDRFAGIESLLDAFYFTLVTASTVGYGDVTATTQAGRLFAMSVVILGTASFAVALGALLGPALQARFAAALGRMNERNLDLLDDHVIVLGYGDLTDLLLAELKPEADVVAVVDTADQAAALDASDHDAVVGDPSDETTLERVRLDSARSVLAATQDDATDALAVLTARQLNPDILIVAAATNRENVTKLKRAGADVVISPAVIGSHLLVESALGRGGVESVADRITGTLETGASEEAVASDE